MCGEMRDGTELATPSGMTPAMAQRSHRIALAAVTACLLAECAGTSDTPAYVRVNTPDSVRKADEAACVKTSIGVPEEPARPSTTPAVDRDAVTRCMQAKGYSAPKR
jgi:hypothetical protein